MLDFIIYNKMIDYFIQVPAFINLLLCFVLDYKEINKTDNKKETKTKITKKDKINTFNDRVAYFYSFLILFLIYLLLKNNNTIYAFIIIFIVLYFIYNIINNFFYRKIELSIIDKKMYVFSSFLLPIFLSSEMYIASTKDFYYLMHPIKELLLILFLNVKIIVYIFLFLINISILISNIMLLLNNYKIYTEKFKKIKYKDISLKTYNYYFYKKYSTNFSLIIDMIIYFISFPLHFFIFLTKNITRLFILYIIDLFLKILLFLIGFDNHRNKIVKSIIKIAVIISLVIVYIITLYNKQIISQQIISLYELITTVILIPLIYDSFKKSSQSKEIEAELF